MRLSRQAIVNDLRERQKRGDLSPREERNLATALDWLAQTSGEPFWRRVVADASSRQSDGTSWPAAESAATGLLATLGAVFALAPFGLGQIQANHLVGYMAGAAVLAGSAALIFGRFGRGPGQAPNPAARLPAELILAILAALAFALVTRLAVSVLEGGKPLHWEGLLPDLATSVAAFVTMRAVGFAWADVFRRRGFPTAIEAVAAAGSGLAVAWLPFLSSSFGGRSASGILCLALVPAILAAATACARLDNQGRELKIEQRPAGASGNWWRILPLALGGGLIFGVGTLVAYQKGEIGRTQPADFGDRLADEPPFVARLEGRQVLTLKLTVPQTLEVTATGPEKTDSVLVIGEELVDTGSSRVETTEHEFKAGTTTICAFDLNALSTMNLADELAAEKAQSCGEVLVESLQGFAAKLPRQLALGRLGSGRETTGTIEITVSGGIPAADKRALDWFANLAARQQPFSEASGYALAKIEFEVSAGGQADQKTRIAPGSIFRQTGDGLVPLQARLSSRLDGPLPKTKYRGELVALEKRPNVRQLDLLQTVMTYLEPKWRLFSDELLVQELRAGDESKIAPLEKTRGGLALGELAWASLAYSGQPAGVCRIKKIMENSVQALPVLGWMPGADPESQCYSMNKESLRPLGGGAREGWRWLLDSLQGPKPAEMKIVDGETATCTEPVELPYQSCSALAPKRLSEDDEHPADTFYLMVGEGALGFVRPGVILWGGGESGVYDVVYGYSVCRGDGTTCYVDADSVVPLGPRFHSWFDRLPEDCLKTLKPTASPNGEIDAWPMVDRRKEFHTRGL